MKITYFTSSSGRSYVESLIDRLALDDQVIIDSVLKDIRRYGFSAVGCQFRQIEGKLWEIKISTKSTGYRIFYAMISQEEMVLLHAYRKQGQKAPKHELEVARKRLKEALR